MHSISWLSHISSIRKSSARTLLANKELSAGSKAALAGALAGFAALGDFACLSFDLAMVLVVYDMRAVEQQWQIESFSGTSKGPDM